MLVCAANRDSPEHGACRPLFERWRVSALMREHGIRRIVTRDEGFRRFAFLEVLDPLKVKS